MEKEPSTFVYYKNAIEKQLTIRSLIKDIIFETNE